MFYEHKIQNLMLLMSEIGRVFENVSHIRGNRMWKIREQKNTIKNEHECSREWMGKHIKLGTEKLKTNKLKMKSLTNKYNMTKTSSVSHEIYSR